MVDVSLLFLYLFYYFYKSLVNEIMFDKLYFNDCDFEPSNIKFPLTCFRKVLALMKPTKHKYPYWNPFQVQFQVKHFFLKKYLWTHYWKLATTL